LADSYWVLFAVAALAGIGSGAYHPLGASAASRVSDPRARNTALSLYTVGGTSGFAISPLLAVVVLSWFGARGTLVYLIPGAVGVALLARQMGTVVRTSARRAASQVAEQQRAIPYRSLAQVVGVVMLRSWSFLALVQFVPVWYDDMGYGRAFYGPLTTTMIVAGVAGTLSGGALADRVGGKTVIVGSQLLCIPALVGFVHFPGAAAFGLGALFGVLSDSSLSVTLSAAQRLLPGRTGIASGVILGLGFITSGIGVPITGAIADRAGIGVALTSLSLLCLGAAGLAWMTDGRLYRVSVEAVATSAEDSPLQPAAKTAPGNAG
jgi:FSR family fosmidomycin resistance protein-like MFS transporter